MNFRLVLLLSLFGVVVAVASIFGISSTSEFALWVILPLIAGAVLARRAPSKPFLHGFLTGFVAGILCSVIEALFIGPYLEHNPKTADQLKTLPLPPAVLVLLVSPITAGVSGLWTGFVTWLMARFSRRAPAAAA